MSGKRHKEHSCGIEQGAIGAASSDLVRKENNQVENGKPADMEFPTQGVTIVNIKRVHNLYCTGSNESHRILTECDQRFLDESERLKNKYKKAKMSSLLWNNTRHDLPLEKYFVPLEVDEDHWMGRSPNGETIQLQHIFFVNSESGKHRKQKILIRGNPGYGKSTLIRKLAFDWATLVPGNYLSMFDIVVMIPLIKLADKTIEKAVIDEISKNDEETLLDETKLKFLLLLDGFDEAIKDDKILQFLRSNEQKKFFFNATVVLTSRPQAVDKIWEDFDHHLSIPGFSEEDQCKYINKVLGYKEDIKNKLLNKLNNNSSLSDLCKCPLMLHMFCCLESEKGDRTVSINTLTGLYIELLQLLITRYNNKNSCQETLKGDDYFTNQDLILKLGSLAHGFFKREPLTSLSKHDLHKKFNNENDFKFITGLDIIIPASSDDENTCLYYDFAHQTIAQFLTLFYIADLPPHKQKLAFSEFFYPCNDLFIICIFFGLMKEKILESKYTLERFSDKIWQAEWIDKFKNEISQDTWDKLFLRKFIRKLSCGADSLKTDAAWFPLHDHLEKMEVTISLKTDHWNDLRTEVVRTIKRCTKLKSLTVTIYPYSQLQVDFDNGGAELRLNISFLMDDLIELSCLKHLVEFHINVKDVSIFDTYAAESKLDGDSGCSADSDSEFGIRSDKLVKLKGVLNSVLWTIGKIEVTVTFKHVTGGTNPKDIKYAMLVISEKQYCEISHHYPKQLEVLVKDRKVVQLNAVNH